MPKLQGPSATSLVLAALVSLASAGARADEGDLYLDLVVTPEVALVSHPDAGVDAFALPFAKTSSTALVPRGALALRYGLTNEWHIGAGVDVGVTTGPEAAGVQVENTTGSLLPQSLVTVSLPLQLGYRFDSGENATGALELSAAPLFVHWGQGALVDRDNLDEDGLPRKLPVDVDERLLFGAVVRAQALFEVRLWDVFAFAVGPTAGVSWAGTLGVHAGVVLRPSWVGAPL